MFKVKKNADIMLQASVIYTNLENNYDNSNKNGATTNK